MTQYLPTLAPKGDSTRSPLLAHVSFYPTT